MKKTIFTLSVFALIFCANISNAQTIVDANVSLSNVTSNTYFDNYNDNTKMVNGLNFEVLCDGTNSDDVTNPFTIKVYIWDGSNPTFVETFNDPGINHFGGHEYTNKTVDLSSLQLPAGTYRLGVVVNADGDIPNPPDDPSDNAGLLEGNIVFTPGSGSAGLTANQNLSTSIHLFPNPATNNLKISWNGKAGNGITKISITGIDGQLVKEMNTNSDQSFAAIDISDLPQGVYIVHTISNDAVITKKFVKD